MIEATLADIRKPSIQFAAYDDIVHIVDGRKKEEIGFFIPRSFGKEFQEFIQVVEKRKKQELLKRVSNAQRKDPIAEGGVGDDIA